MENLTKEQANLILKTAKNRWFKDWKKIVEAIIPARPMCRDCADEDGACPGNDNLPCDTTDEVIERFKRLEYELASLRQQLKEREESIRELLTIAERYKPIHWYPEDPVIISRAKALLDKK